MEALRQAQLDLLLGKISGSGSASGNSGNSGAASKANDNASNNSKVAATGRGFDVVETSTPVPAGFAHPYYWAPFVLMGNWQ